MTYDLIIIGGGIAGITAAIYAKRSNLNVLIIEKNAITTSINPDNSVDPIKSIILVDITVAKLVQSITSYNIEAKNKSTNT